MHTGLLGTFPKKQSSFNVGKKLEKGGDRCQFSSTRFWLWCPIPPSPYTNFSRSRSHRVKQLRRSFIIGLTLKKMPTGTLATFFVVVWREVYWSITLWQEPIDFKKSMHHSYQKSKSSFAERKDRKKGGGLRLFFLSSSPVSNGEIVSVLSEETNVRLFMLLFRQCKMLENTEVTFFFPTPRERNVIRSNNESQLMPNYGS